MDDNKTLSYKIDKEFCDIKVEYKIKAEELDRKTLELEHLRIDRKNSEWELKILYDKIEILKQELYKIKVNANEEMSLVRAENN